jgi:DDE family transposase
VKYTKQKYRVRNWRLYEAGLRKRGDLTLWFSEEAIAAWRAPTGEKPGGQLVYSNLAVEAGLTVRLVYGLALRQTEGFFQSISTLLNLGLGIPDHTTLSRRSKDLNLRVSVSANDGPLHIIIDSTGLRVHSGNIPGSSPPKRRAWRELHIVIRAETGEILASARPTHRAGDAAQVPTLLSQIADPLASAMADGAYDRSSAYSAIEARGPGPPEILIPPRQDAQTRSGANSSSQRSATVRAIGVAGRRQWAHNSGYTRRSLVETAMWRYKVAVGRSSRSRTMASQKTEAARA